MRQQQTKSEKKEFWQKQIETEKKFPGSKAAFCKANDLSINTFNYYRKKFSKETKSASAVGSSFVPVTVKKPIFQQRKGRSFPDPRWVADLILHIQEGLL